jgi:hypothetical protein
MNINAHKNTSSSELVDHIYSSDDEQYTHAFGEGEAHDEDIGLGSAKVRD